MINYFLAIDLPDPLKEDLSMLKMHLPGAKWVPTDNYHLTLHFLGPLTPVQRRDLSLLFEEQNLNIEPFTARTQGIDYFATKNLLKILFAKIAPHPSLLRLHSKLKTLLTQLQLPFPQRKFIPHITLCRFDQAPVQSIAPFLQHFSLLGAKDFPVDEIVLFSSFQSAKKSSSDQSNIYQRENSFSLHKNR